MANDDSKKAFGHGSKESDIGDVIGAYAGEDKARTASDTAGVRRFASSVAGEPDTIDGETVAQMRVRVKGEREAADPTPFQASIVGRRPGEVAPSLATATPITGSTGSATSVPGTGVGTGASGTTGSGAGAGGTGTTGGSTTPR